MRSIAQCNLCKLKHICTTNNTIYITGSIHISGHTLEVLEWGCAGEVLFVVGAWEKDQRPFKNLMKTGSELEGWQI